MRTWQNTRRDTICSVARQFLKKFVKYRKSGFKLFNNENKKNILNLRHTNKL